MAMSLLSNVESHSEPLSILASENFPSWKVIDSRHRGGPDGAMSSLFRFASAVRRHPEVEAWFSADEPLRQLARAWFERIRALGPDVRELLHDGHPTACVDDAAFAYVDAFAAHVGIGFYEGASLPDPAGLLEGAGKRMRHVKLRLGRPVDEAALADLLAAAQGDMRRRVDSGE
jgi:hypothetical protein